MNSVNFQNHSIRQFEVTRSRPIVNSAADKARLWCVKFKTERSLFQTSRVASYTRDYNAGARDRGNRNVSRDSSEEFAPFPRKKLMIIATPPNPPDACINMYFHGLLRAFRLANRVRSLYAFRENAQYRYNKGSCASVSIFYFIFFFSRDVRDPR